MKEIVINLSSSIGLLLFQVWLPGITIFLLLVRNKSWTLTDAYLLGWVWNVLIGLILTPLSNDTSVISLGGKVSSGLLIGTFMVAQLSAKLRVNKNEYVSLLIRSLTQWHFIIAGTSGLVIIGFVFTHSVGFDDVANLEYIYNILQGVVYPEYRTLVGEWEAARYPMWGVVMGGLAYGVSGGVFSLYYLFGISILIAFVVKIYEIIIVNKKNKGIAITAVLVVVTILMVGSLDNYLNYGIYPLQQAKILYIAGLLYLVVGWLLQQIRTNLWMGIGLVSAATFYHINLFLTHAVFLILAFIYISYSARNLKKWIIYMLIIITPMVVAIPSAIMPDNGFLRIEEKQEASTGILVEIPEQSFYKIFVLRVKKLINWVNEGHRKEFYKSRAFSPEVWLIPLVVLLLIQIKYIGRYSSWMIIISILIISQQTVKTVAQQLVSSSLRSGTAWMLYDLLRFDIKNQLSGKILTDRFTGLYLKIFGYNGVQELNEENELLAFSPLFPLVCRDEVASRNGTVKKDRVVLNGRYWGMMSVDRWQGRDELKFITISFTVSIKCLTISFSPQQAAMCFLSTVFRRA